MCPVTNPLTLLMSGTAGLDKNIGELINLTFSTAHRPQAFLCQLTGTFILAILEQFHDAAFIWSKPGDLTDQITDKLYTFGDRLPRNQTIRIMNDVIGDSKVKRGMAVNCTMVVSTDGWMTTTWVCKPVGPPPHPLARQKVKDGHRS